MICRMKVFNRMQIDIINKVFIFVLSYRFEKSLRITLNEEIWAGWMFWRFRQGLSSGKIYRLTIDQHHCYTYSCLDLLPCKIAWNIILLFNWIEHQLTWWLISATCVTFSVTPYFFLTAASFSPQLFYYDNFRDGFSPSPCFCLIASLCLWERKRNGERRRRWERNKNTPYQYHYL